MEQLNRIELRGVVGNVKFQSFEGNPSVIFSLATSRAYHDRKGAAVIEVTWHNVIAYESREVKNLKDLQKGSKVYVCGRIRSQKYTGADGVERSGYDVVASRLVYVGADDTLDVEM